METLNRNLAVLFSGPQEQHEVHLLFIEDDCDDALLIETELAEAACVRFAITHAHRLEEGLQRLHSEHFDVVLLDLALPDSTGLESYLRVHQASATVPVVVVSSANEPGLPARALEAGVREFLAKVPDTHSIARAIERWCLEERTSLYAREQFAIAALGQRALEGTELQELLSQAATLVTQTLNVERCCILQRTCEEKLLLSAGTGVQEELLGSEIAVDAASSLRDHDVKSSLTAQIQGRDSLWGCIEVHSTKQRTFRKHEVNFVESIAQILGQVIKRGAAEIALQASEARYRTIVHSAMDGIITVDEEGHIIDFNPAAEFMLGYRRGDVVGRPMPQLLISPALRKHFEEVKKALSLDQRTLSRRIEVSAVRPDGDELLVEVALVGVGNTPKPLFIGTVRDITERKLAEEQLRRQQVMLASAVRIAGLGSWDYDILNDRLQWSDETLRIFGTSRETFGGRIADFLAFLHPDDREAMERVHSNTCHNDGSIELEYRIRRPDGQERFIYGRGETTYGETGEPIRRTGMVLDITERKRNERQLAAFATLGRQLGGADSAHEAARIILEAADTLLGWDTCSVELFASAKDHCRPVLQVRSEQGRHREIASKKEDHAPCVHYRRAIVEGPQLFLRDKPEFGTPDPCCYGGQAWLSMIIAPVLHRGEIVAILSIQSFSPNAYRSEDLAALEALADHCGGALAQIQARGALRESEARFASVFRTSPAGISISTVSTGRFIEVNNHHCEVTGYSREELLGHKLVCADLWANPDDRARAMQRLLAEGSLHDLETRLRCKSGELRDVVVSLELIALAGEPEAAVVAVITDITARKAAERQLRQNQSLLKMASRVSRLGAWKVDLPSMVLTWSEEVRSIHEVPPDYEPTVEKALDFYALESRATIGKVFWECVREGTPYDVELQIITATGRRVWVRTMGEAARGPDGAILHVQGAFQDINESKRNEEKIREQAALLDKAQDAIVVRDMDHRIHYWNRSAERLYGWTAEEALGRTLDRLLHRDADAFEAANEATLAKGEWVGEIEQVTKGGQVISVEARWTLVRDDHGNPKSILAINTDVTQRNRMEAQFLRAQRMESIGTLAGGIAHDLNNVLSPILMSVEMLEEKISDKEGHSILRAVQSSAQRGSDLVKQVLSFARGMEGKRVNINLRHILRDIQILAQDTFPKNIAFRFQCPRELWILMGDPTQLHQVFINLCVNARDAMPDGGRLTVTLENATVDEEFARLNPGLAPGTYILATVADTGTGIAPSIRDKIFEPFFTTKKLGSGTGLGLSTTLTIVKSHHGFIDVESELGTGTRFKVYLPAKADEGSADDLIPEEDHLPRGNGELVLLIDDEEAVRTVAKKTLERFGYRVVTAVNGAEGVGIYAQQQNQIRLVLTDMAMPVMDGPATILALKEFNPDVRIIASSGMASSADFAKAQEAGIRDFISKPYTTGTLLKTLYRALHSPEDQP